MAKDNFNADIERELDIAIARWGENLELKCIECSRGNTLGDEDLLRMLRYFSEHGTVHSRIIPSEEPLEGGHTSALSNARRSH
jgi:hypothetical protein